MTFREYFGVSCVTNPRHVPLIMQAAPKNSGRAIMIGIDANHARLLGRTSKHAEHYPLRSLWRKIFQNHERALNVLHVRIKKKHLGLWKDPDRAYDWLMEAKEKAGPYCHGFQFNIPWPDPKLIRHLSIQFPRIVLILQMGVNSFEEVSNMPEELASRFANDYGHNFDSILFDHSEGKGRSLDPRFLRRYLLATLQRLPGMGVGVAGNLGPDTLFELVRPLVRDFGSQLSVDAYRGLRKKNGELSLVKTARYLKKCHEIFEGY